MAIAKPQPSPKTTDTIMKALASIVEPQTVYVLGLQQIIEGTPPGEQNFAGWRYLTDIAPDLAVAGYISQQDGAPTFAGIAYGRQLADAVRASEEVETRPEVAGATYELRLLGVPGLLVDAYWLHWANDRGSDKDFIFPYGTISSGLDSTKLYRMTEFLDAIRDLAKERNYPLPEAVTKPQS